MASLPSLSRLVGKRMSRAVMDLICTPRMRSNSSASVRASMRIPLFGSAPFVPLAILSSSTLARLAAGELLFGTTSPNNVPASSCSGIFLPDEQQTVLPD